LDIQVSHGVLRLLVHPPSHEPDYFVFSSLINTTEEEGEEHPPMNPAFAALANPSLNDHLFLFTRMIHRSDLLSQASEIHLGVDAIIPCLAPVFGSLVRACERAKKIVLNGSENFFILPIIFDDIDHSFDAFFRGSDPNWSSSEFDSDSNPDSDSDSELEEPVLPTETKRRSIPSIINFLYTDFDISTLDDKYHFMHLVIWHQSLSPLIRDIFWPVTVRSSSTTNRLEAMSMRDMMDYYLKPSVIV